MRGGPLRLSGRPGNRSVLRGSGDRTRRRTLRGRPRRGRGGGPTRARATGPRGVHTTNSSPGQPGDESVDTTNSPTVASGRRERKATNAAYGQPCASSVDATALSCGAPQERSPSRKQTHRVGNQAVRASQSELIAWRNRAMRASWGERSSGNRAAICRDKLDLWATATSRAS